MDWTLVNPIKFNVTLNLIENPTVSARILPYKFKEP